MTADEAYNILAAESPHTVCWNCDGCCDCCEYLEAFDFMLKEFKWQIQLDSVFSAYQNKIEGNRLER